MNYADNGMCKGGGGIDYSGIGVVLVVAAMLMEIKVLGEVEQGMPQFTGELLVLMMELQVNLI